MALSARYADFLQEQMAEFGPVTLRRMFSGAGVYRDGVIFALVLGDVLYFKTDGPGRAAFEAEGLGPFTYQTKSGARVVNAYWRAPERCLDDPSDMAEWCRRAYDVALKAKKRR